MILHRHRQSSARGASETSPARKGWVRLSTTISQSAGGATRTSAFVVADLEVGSLVFVAAAFLGGRSFFLQGVGALAPTLPAPPTQASAPEDSAITFVIPTGAPAHSSKRAMEGSRQHFHPERTAP
jgi:hypothetical protein